LPNKGGDVNKKDIVSKKTFYENVISWTQSVTEIHRVEFCGPLP